MTKQRVERYARPVDVVSFRTFNNREGFMSAEQHIWINGRVMRMSEATIGVEDRGFQFADGVYEVFRVYEGKPFALELHLQRLRRSCDAIDLPLPYTNAQLIDAMACLYERQPLPSAMIYLQATRGECNRNHVMPRECEPTVLFYARPLPALVVPENAPGVRVISVDDDRWKRCWIKSIALLPNVLAKTAADRAGADEAIFVDNGLAVEGASSNLFVIRRGVIITAPPGPKVLPGITRHILLEIAERMKVPVEHRAATIAEAESADEAFIASTTRELAWIRSWNGRPIGDGKLGDLTLRLHHAFRAQVESPGDGACGPGVR